MSRYIEYAREKIFVCCPFDMMMDGMLEKIEAAGINPEVGLNGRVPEMFSERDFINVSEIMAKSGIRCTVHAPFIDLVLGATDVKIRNVSLDRIKYAVDAAIVLGARHIVFHSGYDPRHHSENRDRFLDNFLSSLDTLAGFVSGTGMRLMLENVYEPDPWLHREVFGSIDSDNVGFCLDPGHAVVFSETEPSVWLDEVGEWLGHMHLHDNNGGSDEHLPPGRGIIDFDEIFRWLKASGATPVLTIEPHKEEYVYPALDAVGRLMSKYDLTGL
jgi:sugar phosphate isomerase/epimerase